MTNTAPAPKPPLSRRGIIAAALTLSVALPLAVAGALWALTALLLPSLPSLITIHWGPSGPDGFANPLLLPVWLLAAVLGIQLLIAFLSWIGQRGTAPQTSDWPRMLVTGTVMFTVLLGLGFLATLISQLGLSDPRLASLWPTLLGIAGGILLAVPLTLLSWKRFPSIAAPHAAPKAQDLPSIALSPTEHVFWSRTAAPPAWLVIGVIGLVVALLAGLAISGSPFWLHLTVGVVFAAIFGILSWKVTINDHSVSVRSLWGFPKFSFAISSLTAAQSTAVRPLAEFGGYGIRTALSGRWGVIANHERALELFPEGKSAFVVTVKDSETAAQLINGIRARLAHHHDAQSDTHADAQALQSPDGNPSDTKPSTAQTPNANHSNSHQPNPAPKEKQ